LALGVVALGLAAASSARAAGAGEASIAEFQLFPLLFLTLGPIKIVAPFFKATRGLEPAQKAKTAVVAIAFASAILVFAGLLGESLLDKYGIPLPDLALAGGIILFLSALTAVLPQFSESAATPTAPPQTQAFALTRVAMTPLAFPTIVTPTGVAVLIVFLALAPNFGTRLEIAEFVAGIMGLNFIAMLLTPWIMPALSILLPIVGSVLGVIQVALGLEIIKVSCEALMKVS
jgi:multiple antibiotic resistance protein